MRFLETLIRNRTHDPHRLHRNALVEQPAIALLAALGWETVNAYHELADDCERQAAILRLKNTTLRRTRDLLLPRLISGEVDVSELDIAVPEEAGG